MTRKKAISHYRIIREISHGGMGQLYETHDLQTRLQVALKVLNLESYITNREAMISRDGTDQANRQLGSGIYFITLTAGDYSETEKVLLVR